MVDAEKGAAIGSNRFLRLAACMTDTDWSFSLRSATRFCDAPDSDDNDEGDITDTGNTSHLSSNNSLFWQIDLAPREDNAHYKPNPWSIAKVNAATRSRQPNATVSSIPKKPVIKNLPQAAIVDGFKRETQKLQKSSTQANLPHNSSQIPTFTCVTGAFDNLVDVPASSSTSAAHISTPGVNSVSILPQPQTTEQCPSSPLHPFLPRKSPSAPHPGRSTSRPPNPHFTPNLKRVLPFSGPGLPSPRSQRSDPSTSGLLLASVHAPAHFLPRILEPQTITPDNAHLVTDHPALIAELARPSRSHHKPTVVGPERKAISPYPSQNTRLPPLYNQPITRAPPKSEKIYSSPSVAQSLHFVEHGPPPLATIKHPSPKSAPPRKESRSTPSPPRPQFTGPSRKRADAYDQLPPSPDSEWSTLKLPMRKVNKKAKANTLDMKSGKFKLPLSLGTIRPKEPSSREKARVVTYLPPPPSKRPKIMAEPHTRTRTGGLFSPPPSDETAPPSSPTPSVRFDSNDVSTRYKLVRSKIREVRIPDGHPPSLYHLMYSLFSFAFSSGRRSAFNSGISLGWIVVVWCTEIQNTRAMLIHGTERLLLSPGTRSETEH